MMPAVQSSKHLLTSDQRTWLGDKVELQHLEKNIESVDGPVMVVKLRLILSVSEVQKPVALISAGSEVTLDCC
jgi:hypothetical protein